MGRYYSTDTGREGKFMFGTQPSDDPAIFGMTENQNSIQYYIEDGDTETVVKVLDEQYDLLDIPKKDRIYEKTDTYDKWYEEVLIPAGFVKVNRKDVKTDTMLWATDKSDYVSVEKKFNESALAVARVALGLDILSDLKQQGYCSLEAEL